VFEVSVADSPEGVTVTASGEVDMLTAARLRLALGEAVTAAGVRPVIVDLNGVGFLDSSGVQALVDGYHMAMVAGGTLTVRGVRGTPARVLRLVGLAKLFGVSDDDGPEWPA
jgi:anti-sigma B factor antagonist